MNAELLKYSCLLRFNYEQQTLSIQKQPALLLSVLSLLCKPRTPLFWAAFIDIKGFKTEATHQIAAQVCLLRLISRDMVMLLVCSNEEGKACFKLHLNATSYKNKLCIF